MDVSVLGASGGYPEPGAPCSGYLVVSDGARIWLDAGAGTLERLLGHIDPWELDAAWLSHLHPDHWTDLPIALHRMAVTGPRPDRPPLQVHGPPGWDTHTGVAAQAYPPERTPHEVLAHRDGGQVRIGDLQLTTRAVDHGMAAFGVRIEGPTGVLAYSGDTAACSALVDLARGADVLLCEATLPPGASTPISMNPEQAGAVAREAGVRQLVLTHLLPHVDAMASRRAAAAVFGGPVDLAVPGRRIAVRPGSS